MLTQRQIINAISRGSGGDSAANRLARLRARSVPSFPGERLRDIVMRDGSNEVLIAAIEADDVDVLMELRDGYGITGDDFRTNESEVFRVIASQDQEEYDFNQILRELRDGFGLDLDDVRESGAINVAASVGNVFFLRSLREVFGIVDDDIRAEGNAALISAAAGNNADFLREIRTVYGLTARDARDGENQALISAASAGHDEVLRELLFGFELTAEDARARDNQALAEAVENRQNDAILILLYGFGLSPRDLDSRNRFVVRTAVRTRNQELVRMIRRFQSADLTDDERRLYREEIEREYALDLMDEDEVDEEDGREPEPEVMMTPPQPTLTESTLFNISPALNIDYNLETGRCFDFIAFDEVAAREYLEEDEDNVIMINVAEGKALCFTKSRLREIAADPGERFLECLGPIVNAATGEKSQRWIPENPPLYVKVPSNPETGTNSFIPYENIMEAVDSRERIFCIVPLNLGDGSGVQASFTHTITEKNWRQLLGFSYVSTNHCQRGSNILLYRFVKCRFSRTSRRAPSWSLEPPTTTSSGRRARSRSPQRRRIRDGRPQRATSR